MPEYLAPGVYLEEVSSGARSIERVSTSTAAFIGPARQGPTDCASDALTTLRDFEQQYGEAAEISFSDGTRLPHFMWHAARAFFENGGRRLHVVRVAGGDGLRPGAAEYIAALATLDRVPDVAIVAVPGSTFAYERGCQKDADAIISALLATHGRFAIVDSGDGQSPADVRTMRARVDSPDGALYYPWVRVTNPASGGDIHLPPSGFIAGIYARADAARGVHKAPVNEVVRLATGLEREVGRDHDTLNREGISCLRTFPDRGTVVWGARTLSSNPEWTYVNVRRYFAYLESSIARGTRWVVFEPNNVSLWTAVRTAVENFLVNEWKRGALQGATLAEAFFVKCDHTTMTQEDIDSGRLNVLIGFAPLRPAEFVIFRIGQWTASRNS